MHKSEMDSTLLEPERGWVTLEVSEPWFVTFVTEVSLYSPLLSFPAFAQLSNKRLSLSPRRMPEKAPSG